MIPHFTAIFWVNGIMWPTIYHNVTMVDTLGLHSQLQLDLPDSSTLDGVTLISNDVRLYGWMWSHTILDWQTDHANWG